MALGCDKSTGLTRGAWLFLLLHNPWASLAPRRRKWTFLALLETYRLMERQIWQTGAQKHELRNKQPPILLYPRCYDQDRFWTPSLTFLQALMDDGTALSVLPPSTSIDSEPSNMADDWKLLQGKRAQSWLCQSEFSSKTSLFKKKNLESVKSGYLGLLERPIDCHICSNCKAGTLICWIKQTVIVRREMHFNILHRILHSLQLDPS